MIPTTAVDDPIEWHRATVGDAVAPTRRREERVDDRRGGRPVGTVRSQRARGPGAKHPIQIVWEQVSAVMVLILIAASLLSLALGKYLEASAIGAIVVLFATLGFLQEYRAERAIAALRKLSVPVVRVVRDGRRVEIASVDLVPGDIVIVEAGSVVPADRSAPVADDDLHQPRLPPGFQAIGTRSSTESLRTSG